MKIPAALAFAFVAALALPACAEAAGASRWSAGADATPAEAKANPGEWRAVEAGHLFVFETSKGRILIEAFPEIAPKHVAQFTAIIRSGDFDGTAFHRVIDGFMAQGGDIFALKERESGLPDIPGEFVFEREIAAMPLDAVIGPRDSGKHGYYRGLPIATQPEFLAEMSGAGRVDSWVPHCRGVVSTARTDDPGSANSQFFLMRDQSSHLDKKYTAWGRVVAGVDVVLAIKAGPAATNGAVTQPDTLVSAKVAADIPAAARPKAWVLRTDAPAFAAELETRGEVDVCSLPPVPAVTEN